MTRDELIEAMARAICRASLYEPDLAEHETLPNNESIDGWKNWFGFKPEARAALAAIEAQGLAIVPVEPDDAFWDRVDAHSGRHSRSGETYPVQRNFHRAMIEVAKL